MAVKEYFHETVLIWLPPLLPKTRRVLMFLVDVQ
jgi:hypothetical protein